MNSTRCNIVSPKRSKYVMTMYDFLTKNNTKFINVYQYRDATGKKQYEGMWPGWQTYSVDDLIKERDRRQSCRNNAWFCRLEDTPFVVVDVDIDLGEEHDEMVDDIINTYGGGVITKSFSGKTHIWLKKHHLDKNKGNILGWKPKVDLIYTGIAECQPSGMADVIDFEDLFNSEFDDYRKDDDLDKKVEAKVSEAVLGALTNEQIELLDIIDDKHWGAYGSWCALILTIFKLTGSYDVADEYSQKGHNYDSWENVVKKIDSFRHNAYTEGTIRYYAKLSNIVKYNEIRSKYMKFDDIESVSERDLALKVIEEVGNVFIYDEPSDNVYILNEKTNIWKPCKKGKREVKNLIAPALLPIVDEKLKKWKGKSDKVMEDDEKLLKKKWNAIRGKITNNAPLNSIRECMVDEAARTAKDYQLDKLRPELFCFQNGKAINLETKQVVDIQPADYITFTCDKPYIKLTTAEYNKAHQVFENITNLIFPDDPEQKKSFHSFHRACLSGHKLEKFVMATGEGRNGKGWYYGLLTYVMGSYYYVASKTLITQPEKPGADPATAGIHLKRFVDIREPAENEKMNISRIKELTGETHINARQIYSKNTECVNIAKFGIQCNLIPKTDELPTKAFADRLIIYTFISHFTDNPDDVDEEHNIYPQNQELKKPDFYESIRMYYIMRLVNDTPETLYIPQSVKASADRLVLDNDKFYNWFEENITILDEEVRTKVKKDIPVITFKNFVERYKSANPSKYTTNQIKERLRMNIQLKKQGLLSKINPKTKKDGWTILHCHWKTHHSSNNINIS